MKILKKCLFTVKRILKMEDMEWLSFVMNCWGAFQFVVLNLRLPTFSNSEFQAEIKALKVGNLAPI